VRGGKNRAPSRDISSSMPRRRKSGGEEKSHSLTGGKKRKILSKAEGERGKSLKPPRTPIPKGIRKEKATEERREAAGENYGFLTSKLRGKAYQFWMRKVRGEGS